MSGTPADCVRVALFGLDLRPGLILAGINRGGNLGQDIPISGTVAAVREGLFHGVPGIALSQYMRSEVASPWARSRDLATRAIRHILDGPEMPDGAPPVAFNVNLPCLGADAREARICDTLPSPEPLPVGFEKEEVGGGGAAWKLRYTGDYQARPGGPGSDVATCFGGDVSISRLDRFATVT